MNENISDGRINLAGGEPLLSNNIDKIIDYIYSKGIKVSLITNGFYLNKEFIDRHKNQLYCIGISVDSLNAETNRLIGRCQINEECLETNHLTDICQYIKDSDIKLKINTCVSKLNYKEDLTGFLEVVKPDRYKVLQMLCNDGDIINVKNRITAIEMDEFKNCHKKYISVIETEDELKQSYLIVDSKGNVSCDNLHISNYSIFENNISDILNKIELDKIVYNKRYNAEYQYRSINK